MGFGFVFWGFCFVFIVFDFGILGLSIKSLLYGQKLMVGMFLMLDIVVNNMAYNGDPHNVDYSTLHPLNDQSYFHPYCPINYSDRDSTLNVPSSNIST